MIDLRSDTITRPTEAMLESMREASFGDDSRDGDETVARLEALAAERMGKEAAAYMPSGTMTNLVAVLAHTQRGGEVLLEAGAHIINSELGGITAVAGAFYKGIPGHRGAMDLEKLAQAIRPRTRQNFGTALVCMETTHNRAGGAVLPLEAMRAVCDLASSNGVPVHIDGARVFNAAVKLGMPVKQLCDGFDTVSVCLSKGLGTPAGTVLVGKKDVIERARRIRKMLGGTMRQVGILGAAGLYALEHNVDRLAEDHANAEKLARGLAALGLPVDPVQTNMVFVQVPKEQAAALKQHLSDNGVVTLGGAKMRLVTHLDVDSAGIDRALSVFGSFFRKAAAAD